MAVYAGEIFTRLAAQGQTIVVMLDQSKINDFNEVLMVFGAHCRAGASGGLAGSADAGHYRLCDARRLVE